MAYHIWTIQAHIDVKTFINFLDILHYSDDISTITSNFQVLSAHFRAYIQALEKLQLDIATSTDLLGVETRSTGYLFSIGKEPLKSRSSVFALGRSEERRVGKECLL